MVMKFDARGKFVFSFYLITNVMGCQDHSDSIRSQINHTQNANEDSIVNDHDNKSGKNPSAEGEGIPGYLTDPNKILIDFDSKQSLIQVRGLDQAIGIKSGSPAEVLIQVFQMSRE